MISIEELELVIDEASSTSNQNPSIFINLLVSPGAKTTGLTDVYESRLRLKVSEPARDDKANKAVVKLFAKILKTNKSSISIISGHKSKYKKLKLPAKKLEVISLLAEYLKQ